MKLTKIISAFAAASAVLSVTAASVSAVGPGFSVSGKKFTVKDGEEVTSVIQFDKLGREKDFSVVAHIQADHIPAGDYYFYAERDPDDKMREMFEDAVSRSSYKLDDYDIIDIDFFASDGDSIFPDADIYITKTNPAYFNCAFYYDDGEFLKLDYEYCGNGIMIEPSTPEKVVVARLFYKYDDTKDTTSYEVSGSHFDHTTSGSSILPNDGKVISKDGGSDNEKGNQYLEEDAEYPYSTDEPTESKEVSTAPEIRDIEKLVPGGKPAATGDSGTAALVLSAAGAAALFTVFAVSKAKKSEK